MSGRCVLVANGNGEKVDPMTRGYCSVQGCHATGKLNAQHICINGRNSHMTQLTKPEDFDVSVYRSQSRVQLLVHKIDNTSGELVDGWSLFNNAMADARSVALIVPKNECHRALLTKEGVRRVRGHGKHTGCFGQVLKTLITNGTGSQNDGIDDGSVPIGNYRYCGVPIV